MARIDYAGVETVLKDEYMGQVLTIPQQRTSRLFNGFQNVTVEGKQMFIDGIAPVDYRIDNSYNADSQGVDANLFRRQLQTDRMIIEVDYDQHWFDKTAGAGNLSMFISPEMMAATARFMDKVGIDQSQADVKYGEKGDSTMTFAQDGGIIIDATGGISDALLRKINHRFTGTEVIGPDGMADVNFVITEDEQYDMGGLTNLVSGDFQRFYPANAQAMPNGTGYARAYGMKMVTFGAQAETGKQLAEASGVRDCLALANDALLYGMGSGGINFEIVPLKESKISTIRLRLTLELGCTRKNGKNVVVFQTTVKDPASFY